MITLNDQQHKQLDSLLPDLHALKQSLEGAVHPKHIETIERLQASVQFALAQVHKAEEDTFDQNFDKLAAIEDQNGFSTIWSISEVPADKLNEKMPFKIGTLVYESWGPLQQKVVNKKITWLEAWALADELIKLSGDTHHIFIEDFTKVAKQSGVVTLTTGS